ncbi:MAG: hypothetical protein RJA70_282 [Pseudomonadota bacterium]|jgi:hypothetical protein
MPSFDPEPFHSYSLHGLRVSVPFELPGAHSIPASESYDYVLRRASEPLPPPSADATLAAGQSRSGAGYQLFTSHDVHLMLFPDCCDFEAAGSEVRYALNPGAEPTLPGALFANAVLAALLGLRGVPVLHASAVALGGQAIAIAGQSGAGKSSLAAALCTQGAALITDDTLRIELTRGGRVALAGVQELRLRSGAEGVFSDGTTPSRRTGDGRLGVLPLRVLSAPLRAIWLPRLMTGGTTARLELLQGHTRLMGLVQNLRIAGFCDTVVAQLLPGLRELAAQVSIYAAHIPRDLVLSESGRRQLGRAAESCLLAPSLGVQE